MVNHYAVGMSHPGPSAAVIVLSDDERAELVRRAGLPGRWRADRARIILACAEGMANARAGQGLGVAFTSVCKWRRQFAAERLAGLQDAAPVGRRSAPLVLDEAERAQLIRWARRGGRRAFPAGGGDHLAGGRGAPLVLDEAERAQLIRWARRAKTAQFLAMRANIVLRCAEGGTNKEAAADLGVDESTVERWRARFIARRLDGLQDEPRPGRPPSILLDPGGGVIVAPLGAPPRKEPH